MNEKTHKTRCGEIHYWTNDRRDETALIFLPGLTADHRLFDKQVECLAADYRVLTWDPPGHAASWPFSFDFDLMDKARWLDEILLAESIGRPIIVGQSMGGYVGQAYAQLFPGKLAGFVSIDSAPLQRRYVTTAEIWLLKRMEPIYRFYPWKSLCKVGTNGVALSGYGRTLMRDMMRVYEGNQRRYAKLAGHGMSMLARAMEADLPYRLTCPVLLLCGEKDRAGSCVRYNRAWHRVTGFPLHWIRNAGHNANTDQPEHVNELIQSMLDTVNG